MPEHPPDEPVDERPSRQAAKERIMSLVDPDDIVHGIAFMGKDDWHWYYVVVHQREYEGNEYLDERYVQLVREPAREEGREDTLKTNGINRRVQDIGEAAKALHDLYRRVAKDEYGIQEQGIDPEGLSPMYLEVDGDGGDDA